MYKLFSIAEKYNEIVVWGYGNRGKIVLYELEKNLPHKSLYVCDREPCSDSKHTVLLPEEAYKLYPKALFVVGSCLFRRSIIAEMQSLGIPDDNILFGFNIFLPKKRLNNLDYHLTEHCILNCASCSHFSNLAEVEFADFDTFERDVKQIAKVFNKDIYNFNLLGGEPLLHPDIEKFIIAARSILPKSIINIITNGVLLPKMPDSFWVTCHSHNVKIAMTHFPVKTNMTVIEEKAKEFNVLMEYKKNPRFWIKRC